MSRGLLPDTSVLGRAQQPTVAARLERAAAQSRLWGCRPVTLELTYGVPASRVPAALRIHEALPMATVDDRVLDRALEVARLMAERGLHRGAKAMDLVIAAAAENERLTVLHYDADFDRIASVTNQPTEWVAEPGTLD